MHKIGEHDYKGFHIAGYRLPVQATAMTTASTSTAIASSSSRLCAGSQAPRSPLSAKRSTWRKVPP